MSNALKVAITEYLEINLDTERWHCRSCGEDIGPARDNYKKGLLIAERDPREIHRPLLDPEKYEFTHAPDPNWCRMIEYYCQGCATLVEVEYLPPGHPLTHDIELDIDALKKREAAKTGA
ncbi:MAG: acetone carboxylase subunit gamma [Pseudomonadota bacterium]